MNSQVRSAGPGDAGAIAELHAASWRSSYRGAFADAFLDGELGPERRRHWFERLETGPHPDQGVLVAMEDGACVGFICIYLAAEPDWGPLLDNLHVRPDRKGRGIGRRLLQEGIAWIRARGAFDRWHLGVVEANAPARRVYEHLGWTPGERAVHLAPDGTGYAVLRYAQRLPPAEARTDSAPPEGPRPV
ncbi:MAG: GNAT family N-acetyltransferase [Holophaga sp.]|nr:GNAT family N-acetyltransferase [Holophaga sp.]